MLSTHLTSWNEPCRTVHLSKRKYLIEYVKFPLLTCKKSPILGGILELISTLKVLLYKIIKIPLPDITFLLCEDSNDEASFLVGFEGCGDDAVLTRWQAVATAYLSHVDVLRCGGHRPVPGEECTPQGIFALLLAHLITENIFQFSNIACWCITYIQNFQLSNI